MLGEDISLVFSNDGDPVLCYCEAFNLDYHGSHKVIIQRKLEGDWLYDTVQEETQVGGSPSLALDSEGLPRIVYRGIGSVYTSWDGEQWNPEIASGDRYTSKLRLDRNDQPHIFYLLSGIIHHLHRQGSIWETDSLSTENDVVGWFDIEYDTRGQMHVLYGTSNKVIYVYPDRMEDVQEEIVAWERAETAILELDDIDKPHICYDPYWDSTIIYSSFDGVEWSHGIVDSSASLFSFCLSPNGEACVTYRKGGLWFARKTVERWLHEAVDEYFDPHCYPNQASLALNDGNEPRIAYTRHVQVGDDYWSNDVYFAYSSHGSWFTERVSSGKDARLSINPDGSISIAEFSAAAPNIGYLQFHRTMSANAEIPVITETMPFNLRISVITEGSLISLRNDRLQRINVSVYDVTGRRIDSVYMGILDIGDYQWRWPENRHGLRTIPSSVYICSVAGEERRISRPLIFMRY